MKKYLKYFKICIVFILCLAFVYHLSCDLYSEDMEKFKQDIDIPVYIDLEALALNPEDVALDQADS